MLETELKCMLDEGVYKQLETMFVWDSVTDQENHYYSDPSGALKKNGITLRVRTKNGKHVIQVKAHKNADSPLQIAEESEYMTDTVPESFTHEEVMKMTGLDVPASRLGSLTTRRHSLMYCDGVEICLDKNDYLDKTDFEIEIEYTKEIPAGLMADLSSAGVEFKNAAVGKCSRFMQRLTAILRGEV